MVRFVSVDMMIRVGERGKLVPDELRGGPPYMQGERAFVPRQVTLIKALDQGY